MAPSFLQWLCCAWFSPDVPMFPSYTRWVLGVECTTYFTQSVHTLHRGSPVNTLGTHGKGEPWWQVNCHSNGELTLIIKVDQVNVITRVPIYERGGRSQWRRWEKENTARSDGFPELDFPVEPPGGRQAMRQDVCLKSCYSRHRKLMWFWTTLKGHASSKGFPRSGWGLSCYHLAGWLLSALICLLHVFTGVFPNTCPESLLHANSHLRIHCQGTQTQAVSHLNCWNSALNCLHAYTLDSLQILLNMLIVDAVTLWKYNLDQNSQNFAFHSELKFLKLT